MTVDGFHGDAVDGVRLIPEIAVGFALVIFLRRVYRVDQTGNLHEGCARIGALIRAGKRLRSGFQRFGELFAGHVDDGNLVREGQNFSQLRRAEFAFHNIGTQVAAVPERDNVIRIDVEMVDAVGDVVLVKSGMDVSASRESSSSISLPCASVKVVASAMEEDSSRQSASIRERTVFFMVVNSFFSH